MEKEFQKFKDFQLNEGFSKVKWTLPKESPSLKIEGETDGKKVILYIDVADKATANPKWKFEKEDVAIMVSMFYKDNPKEAITVLMDPEDAQRFYDRFNSILIEAEDLKDQNKKKAPPGGGDAGFGGLGGGMGGF